VGLVTGKRPVSAPMTGSPKPTVKPMGFRPSNITPKPLPPKVIVECPKCEAKEEVGLINYSPICCDWCSNLFGKPIWMERDWRRNAPNHL